MLATLRLPLKLLLFFVISFFILSPEPVLQTNKCEQTTARTLVHNSHGQPHAHAYAPPTPTCISFWVALCPSDVEPDETAESLFALSRVVVFPLFRLVKIRRFSLTWPEMYRCSTRPKKAISEQFAWYLTGR